MSAQSFTKKELRLTLILAGANAVFPGTNSNQLILTGLRMSAEVQAVARLSTTADIRVWGMLQADMDALTVAWANPPIVRDNIVILEANSGAGWSQVFRGTILEAQPQYNAQPDVYFQLQAITGYFQKVNPAPPTSYPGSVPIDEIVADLAARMGFEFIVGGDVNAVLNSPYFPGTLYDQLQQACVAANADFYFLGETILVTAQGKPHRERPSIVLNAQSGLIGYPCYERAGLNVMCLYDHAILCGTPILIQESIVPSANGRWYPYATTHHLESEKPGGRWLSQLFCLRVLGEDAAA